MKAFPELLLLLVELLLDELELELVGPPLIHWPVEPLMDATVASTGATSTAEARLFWAVWSAARALATCASAVSRLACVGGAAV
jgi:hypothetical protein